MYRRYLGIFEKSTGKTFVIGKNSEGNITWMRKQSDNDDNIDSE